MSLYIHLSPSFVSFHTKRKALKQIPKALYCSTDQVVHSTINLMSRTANDQWVQYFYHQSMEGGDVASSIEFSDSMITTSTTTTIVTPSNSSTTDHLHNHNHLSPKGCGSKPVRRRSRASKKTPTTLLNANTTNFRALVQQFTGCPSTPFSFGKKGPVNLSFGNYDQQQNQRNATSVAAAFGNHKNHFYDQQQFQPQKHFQRQEQYHQQQVYQDQQSLVSFHNYGHNVISGSDHDGFFMSTNPRSGNYLEIPDGFDMDEISMHEITAGSEYRNNSHFL